MLHKILQDYLTKEKISLRSKQLKAIDIILTSKQGQVFLPTGAGKTIVEVLTTLNDILLKQDKNETGIAVFAAHRILLCEQLLRQLIVYAHGLGLHFDILTVASAGIDEQDIISLREGLGDLLRFCTVEITTKTDSVSKFVEDSKKRNRHTLIVSTYQSFDRLQNIQKIDVVCADEAHTVVEEDKFENVKLVLNKNIIQKIFYFTATPVHGCNGRGMENTEIFGPELFTVTPREAIDDGDILPPVVHRAKVIKGDSLSAIIQSCYLAHRKKIKEISVDLVPQLLISVDGIDDMIKLILKRSFQEWTRELGINTVAFSSGKGYYINGHDADRKQAINKTRELNKNKTPFILFHYDILTEGIDLPNLTGVLPLRELNLVKFLQTCGRAARVTISDRKLLEVQNIKSTIGEDKIVQLNPAMEKPCYWIIIPQSEDLQFNENSENMVKRIREEYELEPFVRDIKETSTSRKTEEVDSPYKVELSKSEIESKTIMTHEFELYQLMTLTDKKLSNEEQENGRNKVIEMLDLALDEMEASNAKSKELGNNSIETSLPTPDRI